MISINRKSITIGFSILMFITTGTFIYYKTHSIKNNNTTSLESASQISKLVEYEIFYNNKEPVTYKSFGTCKRYSIEIRTPLRGMLTYISKQKQVRKGDVLFKISTVKFNKKVGILRQIIENQKKTYDLISSKNKINNKPIETIDEEQQSAIIDKNKLEYLEEMATNNQKIVNNLLENENVFPENEVLENKNKAIRASVEHMEAVYNHEKELLESENRYLRSLLEKQDIDQDDFSVYSPNNGIWNPAVLTAGGYVREDFEVGKFYTNNLYVESFFNIDDIIKDDSNIPFREENKAFFISKNKRLKGKVSYVSHATEKDTACISVRIDIETDEKQPEEMISGLLGEVVIYNGEEENVMWIPEKAIKYDELSAGIFIITDDNIAYRYGIKILDRDESRNLVKISGIKSGSKIITAGVEKLNNLDRITVE